MVEKEKILFKPDIIFTHNSSNLNIDHQLTFQAVITAARPMSDEIVKSIICFETPSATEWQATSNANRFSPNLYIGISKEDLDAKINALNSYVFECRNYPHPRSSDALTTLAKYRGYTVGLQLVETFQINRC